MAGKNDLVLTSWLPFPGFPSGHLGCSRPDPWRFLFAMRKTGAFYVGLLGVAGMIITSDLVGSFPKIPYL